MSELFHWSDEYSVGIETIDAQHHELVDLINRVHSAIHERRGSAVLSASLDDLLEYTRSHFALEERLMEECKYPELDEHKGFHIDLIDQAVALRAKLDVGGVASSFELLHVLRVWLIRHICEADRRFGEFYARQTTRPDWLDDAHQALGKRRWWQFWRA